MRDIQPQDGAGLYPPTKSRNTFAVVSNPNDLFMVIRGVGFHRTDDFPAFLGLIEGIWEDIGVGENWGNGGRVLEKLGIIENTFFDVYRMYVRFIFWSLECHFCLSGNIIWEIDL